MMKTDDIDPKWTFLLHYNLVGRNGESCSEKKKQFGSWKWLLNVAWMLNRHKLKWCRMRMEEPRKGEGGGKEKQKQKQLPSNLPILEWHIFQTVYSLTPNVHMLLGETITTGKGRKSALACWERTSIATTRQSSNRLGLYGRGWPCVFWQLHTASLVPLLMQKNYSSYKGGKPSQSQSQLNPQRNMKMTNY